MLGLVHLWSPDRWARVEESAEGATPVYRRQDINQPVGLSSRFCFVHLYSGGAAQCQTSWICSMWPFRGEEQVKPAVIQSHSAVVHNVCLLGQDSSVSLWLDLGKVKSKALAWWSVTMVVTVVIGQRGNSRVKWIYSHSTVLRRFL